MKEGKKAYVYTRRINGRTDKLQRSMEYKIKIEFVNGCINLGNKASTDYWMTEAAVKSLFRLQVQFLGKLAQ